MKKVLNVLLLAALFIPIALVFAACNSNQQLRKQNGGGEQETGIGQPQEIKVDGWVYVLNQDKNSYSVSVGDNVADDASLTVPSTFQDKPVTKIRNGGFVTNAKIKSITVPAGITHIGQGAFMGCVDTVVYFLGNNVPQENRSFVGYTGWGDSVISVKAVIVPDAALSAYRAAWGYVIHNVETGDVSLKHIYAQSSIIENDFIVENNILKCYIGRESEIVVPASVQHIDNEVFFNNQELTNITLPQGLKTIGAKAFEFLFNLKSINLPEGLESIGWAAFANTGLVSVVLPNSLKELGVYAFGACRELTGIIIPGDITRIEASAFWYCAKLAAVTLPSGLKVIDENAFGMTAISSITLPDSLEEIADHAFYGTAITNIIIPAGCNKLSPMAFVGSPLETISVAGNNSTYRSEQNCIIRIADDTLITGIDTSVIPAGIKHIGKGAFYGRTGLKSVVIPQGVITVQESAFQHCTALENVIMFEGVTSIERWVFSNTHALHTIIIPASVTAISESAFYHGSLSDFNSNLSKIYYGGADIAQWNNIEIGFSGIGRFDRLHICFYSATKPATAGHFWHFDTDGVTPIEWSA